MVKALFLGANLASTSERSERELDLSFVPGPSSTPHRNRKQTNDFEKLIDISFPHQRFISAMVYYFCFYHCHENIGERNCQFLFALRCRESEDNLFRYIGKTFLVVIVLAFLGCFLVLRKALLVSFCVVVWVLFLVFFFFFFFHFLHLVIATPRNCPFLLDSFVGIGGLFV